MRLRLPAMCTLRRRSGISMQAITEGRVTIEAKSLERFLK